MTINSGASVFTIERSVLSSDVKIYEVDYEEIQPGTKNTVLSASANAKENLSKYLLEVVGIKDKKLRKNEYNEVISLTFNVLRKLLLVDEITIQDKTSPIYSGDVSSQTSEKALFRFMLTGIDYPTAF